VTPWQAELELTTLAPGTTHPVSFSKTRAAVRIVPGPTELPAAELRAGEAAWARLDGVLGRGGGEAA